MFLEIRKIPWYKIDLGNQILASCNFIMLIQLHYWLQSLFYIKQYWIQLFGLLPNCNIQLNLLLYNEQKRHHYYLFNYKTILFFKYQTILRYLFQALHISIPPHLFEILILSSMKEHSESRLKKISYFDKEWLPKNL